MQPFTHLMLAIHHSLFALLDNTACCSGQRKLVDSLHALAQPSCSGAIGFRIYTSAALNPNEPKYSRLFLPSVQWNPWLVCCRCLTVEPAEWHSCKRWTWWVWTSSVEETSFYFFSKWLHWKANINSHILSETNTYFSLPSHSHHCSWEE